MGDVAERAGVTRAVLYDHFDSKKSLFLALLEEQNAIFLGHVGASISGSGTRATGCARRSSTVFAFAEQEPATWSLLFGSDVSRRRRADERRRQVHAEPSARSRPLLAADAEAAGIEPGGAVRGHRRDAHRRPARRGRMAGSRTPASSANGSSTRRWSCCGGDSGAARPDGRRSKRCGDRRGPCRPQGQGASANASGRFVFAGFRAPNRAPNSKLTPLFRSRVCESER